MYLTELQAIYFMDCPEAWANFLADNELPHSRELLKKLWSRFETVTPEAIAEYHRLQDQRSRPVWRGWRPDAEALVRFVETDPARTTRMRQVFQLCLVEGLSLDAAAAQVRIGRETVRTYLRRLRAEARRLHALDEIEPLEWEAQPRGSLKGRAPRPGSRT